jgi:pimeloyl-ACP methyl ester carboxylesterase
VKILIGLMLILTASAVSGFAQVVERISIPFGRTNEDLELSLLHKASATEAESHTVLFVHGATFPSSMAVGYRFGGRSWMDELSEAGWDVWALDFLGYGRSSRYAEMQQAANANPPLGRAPVAAEQIRTAVEFILKERRVAKVSIVAHSWGTIAAGLYASRSPQTIDRLVLFGPVAQRLGERVVKETIPAWWCLSERDQIDRFTRYVPKGESQVFEPSAMKVWARAYMKTDNQSEKRESRCVRVPSGPNADIEDAWHGHLGYDPHEIRVPTLIIRGEWDVVTKNEDAAWLFQRMDSAPIKRSMVLSKGTHVMHLESGRLQLYSEVRNFLAGE